MKVVVARVDDFSDGDRKIIDVNGRSVGVFRLGGRFYAIRNLCPHHHGPLCRGFVEQHVSSPLPGQVSIVDGVPMIACPWHGWEYDMETGQSWLGPGKGPGHIDARSYDIAIEKGTQVLEEEQRGEAAPAGPGPDGRMPGPYKADLVEVYIEDDFVVIDD